MRHLLLFSVLLLCTSWAVAQSYPSQGATGNTTGQQNVVGCLSSSGGTYTLTAKNGKSYQLTGDTAKLSEHVGHEMKITGTVVALGIFHRHDGEKPAVKETIDVTSFKHISKTCQGGAMSTSMDELRPDVIDPHFLSAADSFVRRSWRALLEARCLPRERPLQSRLCGPPLSFSSTNYFARICAAFKSQSRRTRAAACGLLLSAGARQCKFPHL